MLEAAAAAADEDVRVVGVRGRAEDADRRRRDALQHVDEDPRGVRSAAAEIDDGAMGSAGRAEPIRQELAQQDRSVDEHVVVWGRVHRAVDGRRNQTRGHAPPCRHLERDTGRCLLPPVEIHERARTIHDSRARPQEPAVVGPSPLIRIPQSSGIAHRDPVSALGVDDPRDRRIVLNGQGIARGAHGDDLTDVLPRVHEPIRAGRPVRNDESAATRRIGDLELDEIRGPVRGDGHAVGELWTGILCAEERDEQQDQIATCTTRSLPDFFASYIA